MLRQHYRDRPLLCIPTGGGKTSIAAEIIRSAVAKGHRCAFLVHRLELVDQAVERLAEFGVRAGRILAGFKEERELPVQVASIPTLVRREHWPAQLVIVDECSHAVSDSWSAVLDRYADSWVIGLTATPIRLDGRGLGDIFGHIVEPVTTRALIDQGFLVEPEVYAPPIDLKGIKVRAGDYSIPELAERMNKIVGNLVEHWIDLAQGQKTVAFAVNIDHSERIVEAFRAAGVRAAHIDGGISRVERADTLARLRSGELDIVSNCMVLSEGWDLPELECAILARPTKSLALFRQMVGRVMRPPGPVIVLDHAGNHHEHGLVTDPIRWSLDDVPKRVGATDTGPAVTTCKNCYAVVSPDADVCPMCGEPIAKAPADPPPVDAPGRLVKFTRPPEATKAEKQAAYEELLHRANLFAYKLGWARRQYQDRFGVWPKFYELEKKLYVCRTHTYEPTDFGPRCSRCLARPG